MTFVCQKWLYISFIKAPKLGIVHSVTESPYDTHARLLMHSLNFSTSIPPSKEQRGSWSRTAANMFNRAMQEDL